MSRAARPERRQQERRVSERRRQPRRNDDRRDGDRRSPSLASTDARRVHAPAVERRRHRQAAVALPHRAFTPITYRGVTSPHIARDWVPRLAEILVAPLALVVSLFAVTAMFGSGIFARHILLAMVVFAITLNSHLHLTQTISGVARHIAAGWLALSSLLLFAGWASGALRYFDTRVLLIWWCVAPVCQFLLEVLLRLAKPALTRLLVPPASAVVVGINEQSIELARRIGEHSANLRMAGFFDDRPDSELPGAQHYPLLGRLDDLPRYANAHHIDLIYISLPMVHQPRIQALLDGLRDTTASVYFVPNIFVTDLIQGRVDSVNGLPVVAVCETPFIGLDGVVKRASDIVFATLLLLLLSPVMLLTGLCVKLSSRGPAIFRQRRYGLDGKRIVIYKFRTMTVTEDDGNIEQAQRHDARVTRLGALLRRTSIDELPQLLNVLQGRMSIVGPRPHAVAHNEMYRRLISGYMLRHKVRPGITGWAQVNGLRGETETLDKMRERVSYDLDYLRNWSLRFDMYIMAKTLWVVMRGRNAY